MQVQTLLRWLIVVRSHQKTGISPHFLCLSGQLYCLFRRVCARARNHRNTSPDCFHRKADHLTVLILIERGGFTRGADSDDPVRSFTNMEFNEPSQAFPINGTIRFHGRNQRDQTTLKHAIFPALKRANGTVAQTTVTTGDPKVLRLIQVNKVID